MPETVDAFARGVLSVLLDPDPLFPRGMFFCLCMFVVDVCYVCCMWGFRGAEGMSMLLFCGVVPRLLPPVFIIFYTLALWRIM